MSIAGKSRVGEDGAVKGKIQSMGWVLGDFVEVWEMEVVEGTGVGYLEEDEGRGR